MTGAYIVHAQSGKPKHTAPILTGVTPLHLWGLFIGQNGGFRFYLLDYSTIKGDYTLASKKVFAPPTPTSSTLISVNFAS